MRTEAIREWFEAKQAAADAEKAAKEARAERDRLAEIAIEALLDEGVDSIRLAGVGTVSVVTVKRCRATDKGAAVDAAELLGLKHLVGVNAQSLSAWVKEMEELGEPIPPQMAAAIDSYEQTQIRVRK